MEKIPSQRSMESRILRYLYICSDNTLTYGSKASVESFGNPVIHIT